MVHCTFSILDIGADGLLVIERLSTQQFARVDDPFEPAKSAHGKGGPVIDATRRFVARAGSWGPDKRMLRPLRLRRWAKCRVRGYGWFDEVKAASELPNS
jgi:hypothetical protein